MGTRRPRRPARACLAKGKVSNGGRPESHRADPDVVFYQAVDDPIGFLGVYKGTGEVGHPRMVDAARRRRDRK